ncbi:MAG: DUF1552 domain-containing protein [Pirellulales bacterium]
MKKSWQLNRRLFLRGAGVSVAVPMLEAMIPSQRTAAAEAIKQPMRMICVGLHLGVHTPSFFPGQAGRGYKMTPLLKAIEPYRNEFTVFSGLDHAGVGKGHPATVNYLTGVDNPRQRKQISLDQVAARAVGSQTRFASLQLEARANNQKGRPLSWAPGGIPLPLVSNPQAVFDRLFRQPKDVDKLKESLTDASSILDHITEDANDLQRKLGKADSGKIDEYLAAIRQVELDIEKAEKFADRPFHDFEDELNIPNTQLSVTQNSQIMYHLTALAFQADLTRVMTFRVPAENHALSHHGKQQAKVNAFVNLQKRYMTEFAGLLKQLKSRPDGEGTLLDNTMVLFGSGMGNASIHSTRNLPILLAGGGFKHGQHLRLTGKEKRPLSNLYVSMLRRMGINVSRFSRSNGSMDGLLT